MNSAVDLCNLALGHIGVDEITDLNGTDKVSRTCNLMYLPTLKYILSQHFWNFAMTRVTLSEDATAPAFGWSAQFILPSDYQLLYQTNPDEINYEMEDGKILCNQSTLSIKYVKTVTDVTKFHSAFVDALVYKLAQKMAWPLVQSRSLANEMRSNYDEVIRNAKASDAIAAPINELISDTFLDARVSGAQPYGRY